MRIHHFVHPGKYEERTRIVHELHHSVLFLLLFLAHTLLFYFSEEKTLAHTHTHTHSLTHTHTHTLTHSHALTLSHSHTHTSERKHLDSNSGVKVTGLII